MKGCKQCPAFPKCTVTYRGSACAALLSTYGIENNPEITTNADRIRAMSDEELAMFQAERSAADSFLRIKDEGHEVTAAQRAALINRLYGTWMAYLKQPAEEADHELQT